MSSLPTVGKGGAMSDSSSDTSVWALSAGDEKLKGGSNASVSPSTNEKSNATSRKVLREEERRKRIEGHLTDVRLEEICVCKKDKCDFYIPNVIDCVRGSCSQFDVLGKGKRHLLPPLTSDCCQTFSTIAAVTLSSMGFAVMMQDCYHTSTVNYLLYISAWLHQISAPAWPQRRIRPTISDLNTCLRLHEFFPCQVNNNEFEVLFYNQYNRAKSLIDQLCSTRPKRKRGMSEPDPVCGYIIASGDYTVSVFSLLHDTRNNASNSYVEAWTLFLCDSHGTQPWANNKASITSIALGVKQPGAVGDQSILPKEEGLCHFSMILFALLEDYRSMNTSTLHTPYMTWSPVRRKKMTAMSAEELRKTIDERWLPTLLQDKVMAEAAAVHNFTPLTCFLGSPNRMGFTDKKGRGERSKEELEA